MEETLGQRIRRLRESRKWSQAELGDLVGVSSRTIGNWERDESAPRNRLGTLQEVFGVSLTRDEEPELDEAGEPRLGYLDPVVMAIDHSQLNRANKHKLIGTYYDLLDGQKLDEAPQTSPVASLPTRSEAFNLRQRRAVEQGQLADEAAYEGDT